MPSILSRSRRLTCERPKSVMRLPVYADISLTQPEAKRRAAGLCLFMIRLSRNPTERLIGENTATQRPISF